MKYRVLIERDEDGVFVAEVPSLPGCITQGTSRAEALANVQEAIEGYLESLRAHDEPIPPPHSPAAYHNAESGPSRRVSDR